jgi:hypothetical protein
MRNYYTKNVKFCFLFQDQHCFRLVAIHNTLVRGMRHALCGLGYEVWGMGKKTCRTAKLCRHVIRDEHPRSAKAERDRTA